MSKKEAYQKHRDYLEGEIWFWNNQMEQHLDTPEATKGMGYKWAQQKRDYYQEQLDKVNSDREKVMSGWESTQVKV